MNFTPKEPEKSKQLPRTLFLWSLILLSLGFCARLFWVNFEKVSAYAWDIDPWFGAAAVGLAVITPMGSYAVWMLTLRLLGAAQSLREIYPAWSLSLLIKYLPGSVWNYVGLLYVLRQRGVDGKDVALSFVLDRVAFCIAGIFCFLLSLLVWPDIPLQGHEWPIVALLVLLLVAGHPAVFYPLVNIALVRIGRQPMKKSLRYRDIMLLTAINFLLCLCGGLLMHSVLRCVWPESPSILILAGILSIGSVGGFLILFVPQGLVIQESIMVFFLHQFMPLEVAIVVSILRRLAQIIGEMILGALGWASNPRMLEKLREE